MPYYLRWMLPRAGPTATIAPDRQGQEQNKELRRMRRRRGRGPRKHAQPGLSLVRPDQPCLAKGMPGHGRLDVPVAGQPRHRDRLVDGEQPEYVAVWVIAGRGRWSQVAWAAEAVRPRARFGGLFTLGDSLARRVE